MNTTYNPVYAEFNALVINQLPTGSTFAVNEADYDVEVFIPSRVAEAAKLTPGDRAHIKAIPNRKPDGARWFAIFAKQVEPAHHEQVSEPSVSPTAGIVEMLETLADSLPEATEDTKDPASIEIYLRITDALTELSGAATTAELAERTNIPSRQLSAYLREMHRGGRVARAEITSQAGQLRASAVYWGLTISDLNPCGMEE